MLVLRLWSLDCSCQQIRKQHKHLYVLYLKDGDKSTRMDELRKSVASESLVKDTRLLD
jgi:hypothetical protein